MAALIDTSVGMTLIVPPRAITASMVASAGDGIHDKLVGYGMEDSFQGGVWQATGLTLMLA